MYRLMKTQDIRERFHQAIADTKNTIYLCAPFVKKTIIEDLLKRLDDDVSIKLVTYLNLGHFASGAADLEALELLMDQGAVLYNHENLHAKVFVFDETQAMVSSANLTNAAFYQNYEYGICISEKSMIDDILYDLQELLAEEKSVVIEKKQILEMKDYANTMSSRRHYFIDENSETVLDKEDVIKIAQQVTGWKGLVLEMLLELPNHVLSLKEDIEPSIKKHKHLIEERYPDNKHIHDKVRQQLQYIRNMGLLKFLGNGKYKKLWKED